jgi:hypothetical protein
MHPDTVNIASHMREFGLNVVGRAVYDATFSEMMRPFAHHLAVVHAAHAAEILLKARIAQEHPLLIFDGLPKSKTTTGLLSVQELFEHGKTITYFQLPELLWATTGYRLKATAQFLEFGHLRNKIVHFAAPNIDAAGETLKFTFEVLEPMLQDFWKESVVPYAEAWDDVIASDGYLEEQLVRLNIEITPNLRAALDKKKNEWEAWQERYRELQQQ